VLLYIKKSFPRLASKRPAPGANKLNYCLHPPGEDGQLLGPTGQ